MTRLADGRSDDALIERFLDDRARRCSTSSRSARRSRFKALARYPDYHPEFEGGKPGGRSLDPGLFDTNDARRLEGQAAPQRRSSA